MDEPTPTTPSQAPAAPLAPPTSPQSIYENALIMPWCSACGYPTLPRDRRCSECGTHIRIYSRSPLDPAVMIDELGRSLRGLRWIALACFLSLLIVPVTLGSIVFEGGLLTFTEQGHLPVAWLTLCITCAAVGACIIRRSPITRAVIVAVSLAAVFAMVVFSITATQIEFDPQLGPGERLLWWAARDGVGLVTIAMIVAGSIQLRATQCLRISSYLLWTAIIGLGCAIAISVWVIAFMMLWYFGLAFPALVCGIWAIIIWAWSRVVSRDHRFYQSWRAHHVRAPEPTQPAATK